MRFNLSEWALRHRSLVTYFMLVIAAAGIWSYLRLGRSEDPDFTVKTMVVRVAWPGATVADTLEQITDRIESKLQETPNLDHLKSFTSAGQTTIFVNLKDQTPPGQVPDTWYQVRKKVRDIADTLPQGVVGPASTMSSAIPMASSTASPRTGSRTGRCGTTSSMRASNSCGFRTSPRSTYSARRTSASSSNFPKCNWRALGSTAPR